MWAHIHTLIFPVYKIAQPVSIFRTKLWKMVSNFWTLLLKVYLLKVATFFVALYLSSQLKFISGSSNVKDSCFS